MIDRDQLREMIQDVLWYLNDEIPYSDAAVELLMLTAAAESKLGTYFRQIRGPARGIFQMEPATEDDLWDRFITFKPRLEVMLRNIILPSASSLVPDNTYNLAYQIAMARVHYWRRPEPLPQMQLGLDRMPTPQAIEDLARYWKCHYNTHLGAGTVAKAVMAYQTYAAKGDS